MKLITTAILTLFLTAITFGQTKEVLKADIIIRKVAVIPITKEVILKNQIVAIKNDKIVFIGEDTFSENLNTSAKVIDGSRKYLIPGLADMHAHLPGNKDAFSTNDYLILNLLNGVTTIRQMRGDYADLELKKKINTRQQLGSHLYVSTPILWDGPTFTKQNCIDSLTKYRSAGFDFVKYLYNLNMEQYDTLMGIASQMKYNVGGHAPKGGLAQAVKYGRTSIEHIDPFTSLYQKDSARYFQVIKQMGVNGIFACPDLQWYVLQGFHTTLDTKAAFLTNDLIPQKTIDNWNTEFKNEYIEKMKNDPIGFAKEIVADKKNVDVFLHLLPQIHKAGVKLLISPGAGSFIQPGFSMKDEMNLFSKAGISNYEILKCATSNAAEFLNSGKTCGTIEVGKRADLVLLNSNPLENIANAFDIAGVFIHNNYFSKQTLIKELGK